MPTDRECHVIDPPGTVSLRQSYYDVIGNTLFLPANHFFASNGIQEIMTDPFCTTPAGLRRVNGPGDAFFWNQCLHTFPRPWPVWPGVP